MSKPPSLTDIFASKAYKDIYARFVSCIGDKLERRTPDSSKNFETYYMIGADQSIFRVDADYSMAPCGIGIFIRKEIRPYFTEAGIKFYDVKPKLPPGNSYQLTHVNFEEVQKFVDIATNLTEDDLYQA